MITDPKCSKCGAHDPEGDHIFQWRPCITFLKAERDALNAENAALRKLNADLVAGIEQTAAALADGEEGA